MTCHHQAMVEARDTMVLLPKHRPTTLDDAERVVAAYLTKLSSMGSLEARGLLESHFPETD